MFAKNLQPIAQNKVRVTSIIRKKELSYFNKRNGQKRYAIALWCSIAHIDRFAVTTSFTTSNIDMVPPTFTDKDLSPVENARLTMELTMLMDRVEKMVLAHPEYDATQHKNAVRSIVFGATEAEAEKSAKRQEVYRYIIDKVIPLKRNDSTKDLYKLCADGIKVHDPHVCFDEVTVPWLIGFEGYLRDKGNSDATISIRMRCIRTAYNQAIDEGVADLREYPFRRYKVKNERKQHFTLTAQQLADFRDYPCEEWQVKHRDIAMLTFYMCGINIGDLCLQRTLTEGRFIFKRQKTGVEIDLPVPQEAMDIINKYKGKEYVIDIMEKVVHYQNYGKMCVKGIKKIGPSQVVKDKVGKRRKIVYKPLFPDINLYTMRRTFASIAAELDIPTETIAMCMGHSVVSPYTTTEIYIVRNRRKIDDCVRKVIDYVNSFVGRY